MDPNNIHQEYMENLCEICGDIGFQEEIATCYKCKNVDSSSCSKKFCFSLPIKNCMSGYYVDAPVDWCCKECDIGKGIMSSSHGLDTVQFKESSAMICQNIVQPKKHSKFPHGSMNQRYLPIEESLGLQSGIEKYGSPLINIVSSRVVPIESMAIVTQGHFSNLSPASSTILEHRSPTVVNEGRMKNSSMAHPRVPALVLSWKGSFDILGALELAPEIFNNCIQAHPPCRVQRKVYEFSGLLPDTIKLELVPRGDIWPSLFNNHCPGKEDIGLYFFTSGRNRSERYIALVEFMRTKDLVMRTLISDVELLILASTTLCSVSQRWNNEHFLWGLFYCTGQNTDGCAKGGNNKVIDMEIDMIVGEDVGTLEIMLHSWS
ncbi:hypothetical protein R3W88_019563 [Solanum pinnatisectum]|uniref:AIPP2-like SPOC-like domain-containing protein n=1 Tax=Solanum pinnatisectum TaxID=50273 RepID=A0AAV9KK25_9SOLN|nr:hypothetical protein R3W88_019563 [Solanum pinnatisectum]